MTDGLLWALNLLWETVFYVFMLFVTLIPGGAIIVPGVVLVILWQQAKAWRWER